MELNDKQKNRMLDMLKSFEGGAVQPAELASIIKVLMEVLKQLKQHMEDKVALGDTTLKSNLGKVENGLKELGSKVETSGKNHDNLKSEVSKLPSQISKIDKRVAKLEAEEANEDDLTLDEIEKELPKWGEPIRDSLELLSGKDRLGVKSIDGLDEEIRRLDKDIEENKKMNQMRIIANVRSVNVYDLSTKTDGSTKTFSVPGLTKALFVMGSDFPITLFLNNGFTYSATANTITLTTDNAPSLGSQLAFLYVG